MYIKIYVTAEEKHQLEQLASERGLSLSGMCHEQLLTLLEHPRYVEAPDDRQARDRHIKVHLNEQEYQTIRKLAGGSTLSAYARRSLLSHTKPVELVIYTDDIATLSIQVNEYINRIYNFIAALALRNQLYEADYNRLLTIAADTQTALRDAANAAKSNRKSIRSSGVRILRKRINAELEKLLNKGESS